MVLISLATIEDLSADAASHASSLSQSPMEGVATNVETTSVESSDDEEISDEEMVHSYKVLYKRLVEALNENKALHKKVSHLCSEKDELVKLNNVLLNKLSKLEETLNELEHMTKTVRMLNFGTIDLEKVLEMGKRTKDQRGLGVKGESLQTNLPSLTKATQKGKNLYHWKKKALPALRCYFCRKLGHIKK